MNNLQNQNLLGNKNNNIMNNMINNNKNVKSNNETNEEDKGNNTGISSGKYTCRFEMQIDNDKEFQVARRLIGSKVY
jgi:hypothetical protein